MDRANLKSIFKLTQIGRVAEFIDIITYMYSFSDVRNMFEGNPEYFCIPVETESNISLIYRDEIIKPQKSIFSDNKLEKYIDMQPLSFKANDNVFQVLNRILENTDPNKSHDFIVYYQKSYFGVVRFINLVQYVNNLNLIGERSARDLQQFLIDKSKFHDFPFSVNAYNKMASSLGGDFYKFLKLKNDLVMVSIFDVSGKGITGALSTISISSFFSLYSFGENKKLELKKIVTELNKFISDQTPSDIFITAILIFVDLEKDLLHILNFGHTSTLVYKVNKTENNLVKLNATLPPLGIDDELPDIEKYIIELPISTEQKIVLYSDGLSEATNDDGAMYGDERIKKFFDNNIARPNKEIITDLDKDINSFLRDSPLSDDMTVILIDFSTYIKKTNREFPKQQTMDLESIQYLFHRSFDYSLKLYINSSSSKEQKLHDCKLFYSAKKHEFLILSSSSSGNYSGYIISENNTEYFDENRKFSNIDNIGNIFNSQLTPLHLKMNWFLDNYSISSQNSKTMELIPINQLSCKPNSPDFEYDEIKLIIHQKHLVPFKMELCTPTNTTRITSKKWIHHNTDFFPAEFTIFESKNPEKRTKIFISRIRINQIPENLFRRDFIQTSNLKQIWNE